MKEKVKEIIKNWILEILQVPHITTGFCDIENFKRSRYGL